MRRLATLLIAYFPILLVGGQVLVNGLYFIHRATYLRFGFELNTFFGTNVLFALVFLAITYRFKFCEVSKYCAIAECLFAANFFIVRQDNLYNIWFQIVIGLVAISLTVRHYKHKFPFCRLSLFLNFLKHLKKEKNCEKAVRSYDEEIKTLILKKRYEHENSA